MHCLLCLLLYIFIRVEFCLGQALVHNSARGVPRLVVQLGRRLQRYLLRAYCQLTAIRLTVAPHCS